MLKKNLVIFFLLFVSSVEANQSLYQLYIEIIPGRQLIGQALITPSQSFQINLEGLQNIRLNNKNFNNDNSKLQLNAHKEYKIDYEINLNNQTNFFSTDKHLSLQGNWYPVPESLMPYQLTVKLPENFKAISEADTISKKITQGKAEYTFDFPYPVNHLNLNASSEYVFQSLQYNNITLETWFLPGNAHLAKKYLEKSAEYFELYESLLTPYPYKRFAIVENPLPTGLSMPTFTLLGSRVIALPFILETSLGHEILHQWFGNSVYVNYQHGNWSEGLTNYLADYLYAVQKGNGTEYRKKMLRQYMAYVNESNVFAVRDFRSRFNKVSSTIGYDKVAMIFHQLYRLSGEPAFYQAIRRFILNNQFTMASWHDIQREFETVLNQSLYEDFHTWLNRRDIASFSISKPSELTVEQGKVFLNFSLLQNNTPYHLHVPVVINYPDDQKETRIIHLTEKLQNYKLQLAQVPLKVTLDPFYHMLRTLDINEQEADISRLLGKKSALVVVNDKEKELYQSMIKALNISVIKYISPGKINYQHLKNQSLIIAGNSNPMIKKLLAHSVNEESQQGASIRIKVNPYNNREIIAILNASNQEEGQLAGRKIRHYGQYSSLKFIQGKMLDKHLDSAQQGLTLYEQNIATVIKTRQVMTISDIIRDNPEKRIFLIGEQHDQYAHHLNQLQLIQQLHQSNPKIAIGLEMFQQDYQSVLDALIKGTITEAEFLTRSSYFNHWRYDYNLYKPIIDYAKKHKLPLLALNMNAGITSQVSSSGLDSLSHEQKQQLPENFDLSNPDYIKDLKSVFSMHQNMGGSKKFNFDYFLQSQTLWDETMAANASRFVDENPEHRLVILAGNGHVRKRYGIANRLEKLSNEKVVTIVQDDEIDHSIADYVLVTQPVKGKATPKIGILLDNSEPGKIKIKKVMPDSLAEKAELKAEDVIITIDSKSVRSYTELKLALLYIDQSKPAEITIQRGNNVIKRELKF